MMIALNGYGIAMTLEMGRSLSQLEREKLLDRCSKETQDETQSAAESLCKMFLVIEKFAGTKPSR